MRYNIALIPDRLASMVLLDVAKWASLDRGLKPDYLLREEESIPHASVLQFEGEFSSLALEEIWKHVLTVWREVSANLSGLICSLSPRINYKHTTAGPFASMSWAEILIDKAKNTFTQDFHDGLRERLEPLGVTCLNAAGHHYNPHFTLFNVRSDLLGQADVMVDVPETYVATLSAFTVRPALGIANARWELTTQVYEEKLPQSVNETRLSLGK